MKRTYQVKRLLGIDDGLVGVESDRQRDVHECTVCGTRFDVGDPACSSCGSRLFRTRTVIPNALFNLFVIFTLSGFGVAYNFITGDVPKRSPKEE